MSTNPYEIPSAPVSEPTILELKKQIKYLEDQLNIHNVIRIYIKRGLFGTWIFGLFLGNIVPILYPIGWACFVCAILI